MKVVFGATVEEIKLELLLEAVVLRVDEVIGRDVTVELLKGLVAEREEDEDKKVVVVFDGLIVDREDEEVAKVVGSLGVDTRIVEVSEASFLFVTDVLVAVIVALLYFVVAMEEEDDEERAELLDLELVRSDVEVKIGGITIEVIDDRIELMIVVMG